MKHIQKKISLEQFKSRMPSIITSYDGNAEPQYFDAVSHPYSNYGMIPENIQWNYGTVHNGKLLSYHTISSWFHFCENYIQGLTIDEKCPITYDSYKTYNESYDGCPYALDYCIELDDIFNNTIGGYDAYAYMCETLFPRYVIDTDLIDAWKTDKLYINDILHWIAWFQDRNEKYANLVECNVENIDCCDCEKYHALGGKKMYDNLVDFLRELKKSLTNFIDVSQKQLDESYDADGNYVNACAIIPLYISNSIENMGEFSILSEEWEGGIDYASTLSDENKLNNKSGGTVISYNGNSLIAVDGEDSYLINEYKEFVFNEGGFDDYLPTSIATHNIDENDNYSDFYAYKSNGVLVVNPSKDKMADTYPMNCNINGYFIIANKVYDVFKCFYITYRDAFYEVLYDMSKNPYVIINNRKYFGVYDEKTKVYHILGEEISSSEESFILYNNVLVLVQNNSVKINKTNYPKIDAYIVKDGQIIMFQNGETVEYQYANSKNTTLILVPTTKTLGEKGEDYKCNDSIVSVYLPYAQYNYKQITGLTESKLSSLFSDDIVMYDSLGNKLPGLLRKKGNSYQEVTEGGWLDIYYRPKTMSHLTTENGDIVWGNIIERLTFYFEGKNGKHIGDIVYAINSTKYDSSIDAIEDCWKALEEEQESEGNNFGIKYGAISELKCDIQYLMGANFNLKTLEIINSGVTYVDTVTLTPRQCYYYISDTFCYGLNYYELTWETIEYDNNNYNNLPMSVPQAKFTYPISHENEHDKFANFPLIREEYKLSSSSLENIQTDIYIDRGTARAIDNHLKLLEVHSMESLENYGNSSFNIIKN